MVIRREWTYVGVVGCAHDGWDEARPRVKRLDLMKMMKWQF